MPAAYCRENKNVCVTDCSTFDVSQAEINTLNDKLEDEKRRSVLLVAECETKLKPEARHTLLIRKALN